MEPGTSKPRKVSHFFANEMLFDYLEGRLDLSRRQAVEEALKEDLSLQAELDLLKAASEYCAKMSGTRLNKDFIQEIGASQPLSERAVRMVAWTHWPDLAKWTAEGLAISVVVALMAIAFPWQNISHWRDYLVTRSKSVHPELPQVPPLAKTEDAKLNPDEQPVAKADTKTEAKSASASAAAPAAATPTSATAPATLAKTPTPPTKAAPKSTETAKATVPPAPKGLIYRMMMKIPDVKDMADDVRDKIVSLGGKKAGQVELGWRKPNGNYYHFSMPEKNYDELVKSLGGYGPVRIYKNPHPRVMPPGVIRIILWIEDAPVAAPKDSDTNESTDDGTTAPDQQEPGTEDTPEA